MSYVKITVDNKRMDQFVKDWPMATKVAYGRYDTTFRMGQAIYQKQYKLIDKYGNVQGIPTSNYVKITGIIEGQAVKLFVKEKDCCKVLDKLVKAQDEKPYGQSQLIITMKKVRIPKTRTKLIEPIVMRSLAWVGIAA